MSSENRQGGEEVRFGVSREDLAGQRGVIADVIEAHFTSRWGQTSPVTRAEALVVASALQDAMCRRHDQRKAVYTAPTQAGRLAIDQ